MIRWIAAPLAAAVLFVGSGYLRTLETSTEASVRLAGTTERAPASTQEAVTQLAPLPEVAALTGRQADLAEALAEALQASADRLGKVNGSLQEQTTSLSTLLETVEALDPRMACIRDRTEDLLTASRLPPRALEEIASVLQGVLPWQDKSVRHLRSINRKLAALGVAAVATGVEPPDPPPPAEPPGAGSEPPPVPC